MTRQMIVQLAQGNPGALQVMVQMHKAGADDAIEKCAAQGLTGSKLWILFKDVHKLDIAAVIASIRAGTGGKEVAASERGAE